MSTCTYTYVYEYSYSKLGTHNCNAHPSVTVLKRKSN